MQGSDGRPHGCESRRGPGSRDTEQLVSHKPGEDPIALQTEEQAHREDGRGSVLADISNEMVRLYKEQFGRGPTKTRTLWAGPDQLVTTLEDTFTPAETNLAEMGEHQRLRDTRMFFQYASVREFCEPIERATGRKVKAFVSGIDTESDGLSVEIWVLHPEGSDAPSRMEKAKPQR